MFIKAAILNKKVLLIRVRDYDIWFVLFLVICFLGIAVSESRIITFRESMQFIYLYSIFIVMRSIFYKKENVLLFLKYIFYSAIVFCIFGLLSVIIGRFPIKVTIVDVLHGGVYFLTHLPETQLTEKSGFSIVRISSFFWGSVGSANLLIILYYLIASSKNRYRIGLKIVIVIFLLLTGSRGGWVTFCLLYLIDSIIEKRKLLSRLSISIIVILLGIFFLPAIKERFTEVFSLEEGSSKYHAAIWLTAINIFLHNPLIGIGSGCLPLRLIDSHYFSMLKVYAVHTEAHNLFFKILAENGMFGILFFIIFLVKIIKPIGPYCNNRFPILKNILLAFIGTLIMNMTMNAFMIEPFWILIALLIGAYEFTKDTTSKRGITLSSI